MALNIVELPYSYFPDFGRGRPLFNADIYVGNVDTDPEIPGNQKQVTVRQEDGSEVQIAQPVKTSAGGVPTYLGSPVTVLVDGAYSIKVLDRFGAEEYYAPDVTKGVPLTPETLPTYTDLVFDSVADMELSTTLTEGSKVRTKNTYWMIVANPTYTLPYANRTKVFNNLPLQNSLYAHPISDLFVEDFCSDSVSADNDDQIGKMVSVMRDGLKINPNGKMFRVFANVPGIPSSGADPASDNAGDPSKMLYLDDFRDISFGAGGFYAANQGSTGTKNYYPSTLSLTNCHGVTFDKGSIFESKGQSWGDADASISQDFDRRLVFLATNGGHAIYMGRCGDVKGTPTARLAGSVGAIYCSSCNDVNLESPFSNAASLGYAAYAFDAWVQSLAESNFETFAHTIVNPQTHRETLTRREDGNSTGSSQYAGKGGIATEDRGVTVNVVGGEIADQYANGSARTLGYAFGVGSGSVLISTGTKVRNCQEVSYLFWSVNAIARCEVYDVDAVTGLCGIFCSEQPFGRGYATLTGRLQVDGTRVWPNDGSTPIELRQTSVVANLKQATPMFVDIDLNAGPLVNQDGTTTGSIYALSLNTENACYGGLNINGGQYEIDGYLIRSEGWGGSSANSQRGIVIRGGANIKDVSTRTDSMFFYANQSGAGTFTYIYHDLNDCTIQSNNYRSLDWGTPSGSGLDELQNLPSRLTNCYTETKNYKQGSSRVELISIDGLSGPNRIVTLKMPENKDFRAAYMATDADLVRIIGPQGGFDVSNGDLRRQYVLTGDPSANLTAGNLYGLAADW